MDVASIKEALNFNNNSKFITPHTLGVVLKDFVKSDVVGSLTSLKTSNKTNIVAAINENFASILSAKEIDSYDISPIGYIRFKNGLQIAWCQERFTLGGTLWVAPIYYSDHTLSNWKKPFTAVFTAIPMTSSTLYWSTLGNTSNTSPGTLRAFRPTSGTSSVYVGALGIGKWK